MEVTLDVSKLSGWLKAAALCRVERGHAMRNEVRAGRWDHGRGPAAALARGMHWQGLTEGWGPGGSTRGAHQEHVPHGCDAGRVEAQRLVEH